MLGNHHRLQDVASPDTLPPGLHSDTHLVERMRPDSKPKPYLILPISVLLPCLQITLYYYEWLLKLLPKPHSTRYTSILVGSGRVGVGAPEVKTQIRLNQPSEFKGQASADTQLRNRRWPVGEQHEMTEGWTRMGSGWALKAKVKGLKFILRTIGLPGF